jgi:hypothetical protein
MCKKKQRPDHSGLCVQSELSIVVRYGAASGQIRVKSSRGRMTGGKVR